MDEDQQAQVQESMAYAAQMAQRLDGAGIAEHGDGVTTNTSNYRLTADEGAYATAILDAIGTLELGAVVDTSRNGNGPAPDDEWCDPTAARSESHQQRYRTRPDDTFLWVKLPGEADGCCGGRAVRTRTGVRIGHQPRPSTDR